MQGRVIASASYNPSYNPSCPSALQAMIPVILIDLAFSKRELSSLLTLVWFAEETRKMFYSSIPKYSNKQPY
jgi:hypothetical protein